jgi:hypothetical protein
MIYEILKAKIFWVLTPYILVGQLHSPYPKAGGSMFLRNVDIPLSD